MSDFLNSYLSNPRSRQSKSGADLGSIEVASALQWRPITLAALTFHRP